VPRALASRRTIRAAPAGGRPTPAPAPELQQCAAAMGCRWPLSMQTRRHPVSQHRQPQPNQWAVLQRRYRCHQPPATRQHAHCSRRLALQRLRGCHWQARPTAAAARASTTTGTGNAGTARRRRPGRWMQRGRPRCLQTGIIMMMADEKADEVSEWMRGDRVSVRAAMPS